LESLGRKVTTHIVVVVTVVERNGVVFGNGMDVNGVVFGNGMDVNGVVFGNGMDVNGVVFGNGMDVNGVVFGNGMNVNGVVFCNSVIGVNDVAGIWCSRIRGTPNEFLVYYTVRMLH